ncbi:MAG: putative methylase [Candidatus Diapherotrites archaeon]|nr:putative methylase [Candidatus Diapherotrites archaeon]MDN5367127.1 putative methylase [Candidatus Diapherotrites archaeon]
MYIVDKERAIEQDFPMSEINRISVSERIALKPIYMMHRIFARRVGSVFRAIILGALKDAGTDIMKEFYRSHRDDPDTVGKVILDPMCGGGTTLVEGSRLGATVIGIDINPIPWFVTKCELTVVDPNKLRDAFVKLEQTVGKKIKEMYTTKCPYCGRDAEIIYTFWIKHVDCPKCGRKVDLFKDFVVTYDKKETEYYIVCPECKHVFRLDHAPGEREVCPACGHEFSPNKGFVVNNHVTCPHCAHEFRVVDVLREQESPPEATPYAIDGWCPHCKRRFVKGFDEDDLARLQRVEHEFEEKKESLLFPRDPIPDGYNTNQMKKHNYRYWYQMFNKRQLLALSLLLDEIRKIEDQDIRELFLLAFSETLRSNNMFCYYDKRWAKQLTPLFARKDFAPVNFPLEQNVWGSRFGRGSFVQVFGRLLRGKEYNLRPFERVYSGKSVKRVYLDEVIGDAPWAVYCMDAQYLDSAVKTKVDLVVTDPPYFDSINYSETYDFFYVWLKQVLDYPWFKRDTTIHPSEVIVNKVHGKTEEMFKQKLTNIFRRAVSVLRDDGLFIFTFHDIDPAAWKHMREIVSAAGLRVVKIHFYHGENVSAGHFGGQKSVFDSIWVCRKKSWAKGRHRISLSDAVSHILREVEGVVAAVKKSRYFKLDENDLRVFVYGKTVEILERYAVPEDFDEIVRIVLDDERLQGILEHKAGRRITDYL